MRLCVCDMMEMTKAERLSKQKNAIDTLRRLVSTTECGCAVDGTVDTQAVDDQGNTVVHYAAQLGCCRTLLAVLPHSSPVVCVPNKFGVTPLHVAADRGINDEVQVSICYFCACYQRNVRYHGSCRLINSDGISTQFLVNYLTHFLV